MKLLVSTATQLGPLDLPDEVDVVAFDETERVPTAHRDADAVVLWGLHHDLAAQLADLGNLTWIQTYLAGTEVFENANVPEHVTITFGIGFHDETVAEHALALALATLRRLPQAVAAQAEHRWADELGGIKPLHETGRVTTLIDATVVVWGFGRIGRTIAHRFASLGAHVSGIATSPGERDGFPVVGPEGLDESLASADVLVMVLPHRSDTIGVLNERTLALLPAHAHVINVGRGSAVDEQALAAALESGRLGAAALDVTRQEPLPPDSPLWDVERLLITPHAAGGRPNGAEERIAANVRALLAGSELIGVMPRPSKHSPQS